MSQPSPSSPPRRSTTWPERRATPGLRRGGAATPTAAGKASTKAAGVVIDDTAVTPRYVVGLTPERELPIIGKIAWGSLKNKVLLLLPLALLLTAFAPFLVTPLLMIGGAYLAFEATEKICEKLFHEHEHEEQLVDS